MEGLCFTGVLHWRPFETGHRKLHQDFLVMTSWLFSICNINCTWRTRKGSYRCCEDNEGDSGPLQSIPRFRQLSS